MDYCLYDINIPQGLIPFLKQDSIPIIYTPKDPREKERKQRLMLDSDSQLENKINTTKIFLDRLFPNESHRSSANYLSLYEMFEINNFGRTLLPGKRKEDLHAAYYDHGNKSSTALLLSSMNKYAEVDFTAIQQQLEKIRLKVKNPTEQAILIEQLINNVGNMEFVLSMVAIGEYINGIFDKEIAKYPEGSVERQKLWAEQNERYEHITTLANNYLKQMHQGRQVRYPNIAPNAQNSFAALATKLGQIYLGYDELSRSTYEIKDINMARKLLEPLDKCTDLNKDNPFMDKKPYKQQIDTARTIYYSNNVKTKHSQNTVETTVSFLDDGMFY